LTLDRHGPHPLHPSVLLALSFAAAIGVGTVLLALPVSTVGSPVTVLEALFTATSAVCVTGLTVVDTGTRFSPFGQWVILGLIQAGGLGIMTYALFATLLLGRRISFQHRLVLQDSLHHSPTTRLKALLRHVVVLTLLIEATGAALLWLHWHGELPDRAAYLAVFHAVSAFCNAGFSVFPDGLVRFRGDLVVNAVITGLIIVGGLGFLVSLELRDRLLQRLRGERPAPLSLHARLVVTVTAALLVYGFVGFLVLEWDNLLRGLPPHETLLAAWFQSVTPRTAGFNTVDYGRATAATLYLTVFLMFVGASPGSTGGGIKTTSCGLIVALFHARWRGRGRATLFRRTVPHEAMDRAVALTLLSLALVGTSVLVLTFVEQRFAPANTSGPPFLALLFEAVSAFGTVGLSAGITASLTPLGKLVIIALMFVGRVGPLTVALAAGHSEEKGRIRYAEENVMVG
jgi:trk system potassium uptake protein TrkH